MPHRFVDRFRLPSWFVVVRLAASLVLLLFLAVACGSEVDRGPVRPQPSEEPDGAVVAEITVGETAFRLHDEGDGCVAAQILHPGLQTTVERRCFSGEQVLALTDACGWLAQADGAEDTGDCDLELPRVLYGVVADPSIGHVCVGTIVDSPDSGSGVAGARFVETLAGRFLLVEAMADESEAAHLFTPGGVRYGEPPLDAPSDPIYRLCEDIAPWGENVEATSWLELAFTADDELLSDEWAFGAAGATGGEAFAGGALADETPFVLALRIPASGRDLTVWAESFADGARVFEQRYELPVEFLEVLAESRDCAVSRVAIHLGEAILDGAADAVELAWDGSGC